MLRPGLYEQVINLEIEDFLSTQRDYSIAKGPIDEAEKAKVLTQYVASLIERGLSDVLAQQRGVRAPISLVNQILEAIATATDDPSYTSRAVAEGAEQLLALVEKKNRIHPDAKDLPRPETSIAESSLFTGANYEPQLFTEMKKEILSCDRIDMLVSFIKWSGLRLIIDELRAFTQNGGRLRVITTSYMGATDVKAVEELAKLPNTHIKVSYDTKRTRLHAKTYVFYRDTGFSTAYVGSSNLSNAAISSGLEWNVKVTRQDLSETLEKIKATFDTYWNASEFEAYDASQVQRLATALRGELATPTGPLPVLFDIRPYAFQQEILDKLETERKVHGHSRNLIVAATGTGKTVISAFDYKRFCQAHPGAANRLLFVAHRQEILVQSLATFRGVLRNENFGDLLVGGIEPSQINHLFISVQSLNTRDLTQLIEKDFYDVVIVDEFHHAAAPSYQKLLSHVQPKILLGLTATPERMDGKPITVYFNDRIAAEIRLPEAINRKLLCPFQYFGVSDSVDLDELKWTAGGYDKSALSELYTADAVIANRRAHLIIDALNRYVTDINEVKGLGFCASVAHAQFMNDFFNNEGIPSMVLTGHTPDEERYQAAKRLSAGHIRFIFVVDIYNEGVDIPAVNTVLFLRPTESLTIFLQQLGRGLRLHADKECLTVLDFIGQANRRYRFADKFSALLNDSGRNVEREIRQGFSHVPKGCYVQLEKKAQEAVLQNIRASIDRRDGLVSRLSTFTEDSGLEPDLGAFADYYHLDVRRIYKRDNFSRLSVEAGIREDFSDPLEQTMAKAFTRLAVTDSRRWIRFLLDVLQHERTTFTALEVRMLHMFHFTVWKNSPQECGFNSPLTGIRRIQNNPVMHAELIDLLRYRYGKIDFLDEPVDIGFPCPLDLHCTYTRDQILSAMDFLKPNTVREGVKHLPEKDLDVFFITLNKADKDYSPSTMYEDYSINEWLFHWQSQSTTAADSATGHRYIHHRENGHRILLFVREFKNDRILNGAEAYTFLGKANYVEHEGSKPMSIIWELERPIPAKFLKKTNKLVVG